ncbi:glycosyl hydrolase 115 family protein [Olivibacter sp. XZL3]|uniref:glycosyl hydrolase 115 family protein n=1 Tax=Olivibacter sp. XZL3 TaxID=1735116 RepID=UPI00106598A9|nr:glycosyl hydrolase 115 family protein [Olivibacter sp. XZL3]
MRNHSKVIQKGKKAFTSKFVKSKLLLLGIMTLLLSGKPDNRTTIFTIGDSTMANKDTTRNNPETGWGQVFPSFFSNVSVENHAKDGRSTKSFIDEGRWSVVLNKLKQGDYVFIEFGHNDEKKEVSSLYADSKTTYRENLRRFVWETREKGAYPVLLTSIVRRKFDEAGKLVNTHGDYPNAVRQVAEELKVPLIDMEQKTRQQVTQLGVEESKRIYLHFNSGEHPLYPKGRRDDTHLSRYGAFLVARLVTEGIRELQLPLGKYLKKHNDEILIGKDDSVYVYMSEQEKPVVNTTLAMLKKDIKTVFNSSLLTSAESQKASIIVGTLGQNAIIDRLASEKKINVSGIEKKWEAFLITPVLLEGKKKLVIAGSDSRGTAYGLLELSRMIGVSPWEWWADVTPESKELFVMPTTDIVQAPSVQYRGIFLNDEDWALVPWSTKTYEPTAQSGAIGPKTYAKIFELLLRLRANMICPAMHEVTRSFYTVAGNKEAAEKYGIIVSTSHAEPMMRTNTGEWDSQKFGDFNYFTNKRNIISYWDKRVSELVHSENVYTMGLRGIHDGRMQGVSSLDEETKTLEDVIREQQNMLKKYHPEKKLSDIPQIFVPYKEVLDAYNNNLKLPDNITLVWCDDNNGYLMRLSDEKEKKRSGGAGIYYHISYWGKPHDYLWLASTQPALMCTEVKRAWDNGAQKYWLLNVGDIKPGEYLTELFLDMAWNINSVKAHAIYQHQKNWLGTAFRGIANDAIDTIMKQYYHLSGIRKPEHMGWNKVEDYKDISVLKDNYTRKYGLPPVNNTELSPFYFNDEIDSRLRAYEYIGGLSDSIYNAVMPEVLKPAYFQLVHYPVKAAAAMNRKLLYAQKARLYAQYNLPAAMEYKQKSIQAYNEVTALDRTYNKDLLDGKWQNMMDMKPRNLPVFQLTGLPDIQTENIPGVKIWIENSEKPDTSNTVKLPSFTDGDRQSYFFSVFSTSQKAIEWELLKKPSYVRIKESVSDLLYEKKFEVSLSKTDATQGTFQMNIENKTYTFSFDVNHIKVSSGNVERNRHIAFSASNYSNNEKFEIIEGLGHSGKAVILPAVKKITASATALEYNFYTQSSGKAKLKVGTVFRYPAVPANELRYAVVIDGQQPKIISVKAAFLSNEWAENVLRNQALSELEIALDKPGNHSLKVYALDEPLLFDQIMIDFNLSRKHYVVPAEK